MKRFSLLLAAILLFSCGPNTPEELPTSSPPVRTPQSSLASISALSPASSVSSEAQKIPSRESISVPFSPQAPFANWDPLHEEACEEMSLIMVSHFLEGTPLTREQAEQELQDLVKWEKAQNYPEDVTIEQLGEVAEKYYGYRSRVIENPTLDDLKRVISQGQPVIVPAAGRDLSNPYFSGDGPWYHMLVVTGYGWWSFETNDPGTKRGEGYEYRFEVLMDAIHDWTGIKEEIRKGRSAVLVLDQSK